MGCFAGGAKRFTTQGASHHLFKRAINAEVSIIWGLIFSIYLDIYVLTHMFVRKHKNSHNPDPNAIRNVVIIVAIGAFVTKMLPASYSPDPGAITINLTRSSTRTPEASCFTLAFLVTSNVKLGTLSLKSASGSSSKTMQATPL